MASEREKGSLKNVALLVIPLILIATLFLIPVQIRTNLVSNPNLLSPVWASGYCVSPGSLTHSCPVSLSDANNGLIQISSTEEFSTVLFQLSPSYANLFSHSDVTYNVAATSQTFENVTFKFSQVVNSTYYSGLIAVVSTSPAVASNSTAGSLGLGSLRESFSGALSSPARLEVNVSPSTHQLFIGVRVASGATDSIGTIITMSGLRLSLLFAALGAFYGIFPQAKAARPIGMGLMGGAAIIIGNTVAAETLSSWPPFDPSFAWMFSLSVIIGVAMLALYFVTERSKT